jgi:hypothetical protein
MDGGIEQLADDGSSDCPRYIVTYGAAMIDSIHHAHGDFGLGGFLPVLHSFLH